MSHPVIYRALSIWNTHFGDRNNSISSFGWIGNHYKIVGSAADQTTEKFWSRLKRMVKKVSTQIPGSNVAKGKKEIYAFRQHTKKFREKEYLP